MHFYALCLCFGILYGDFFLIFEASLQTSLLFFFLIFIFLVRTLNVFSLLIVSELFWITLYASSLLFSIITNDVGLLSFSLFFLMFSAAEIAIGLSSFFLQNLLNFSLDLNFFKLNKPQKLSV